MEMKISINLDLYKGQLVNYLSAKKTLPGFTNMHVFQSVLTTFGEWFVVHLTLDLACMDLLHVSLSN